MVGHLLRLASGVERVLLFGAALLRIKPGLLTDTAGLGLLAVVVALRRLRAPAPVPQPTQGARASAAAGTGCGGPVILPPAVFDPLSARVVERCGFETVYVAIYPAELQRAALVAMRAAAAQLRECGFVEEVALASPEERDALVDTDWRRALVDGYQSPASGT
ncbi:MAG: hypothetical protein C4303_02835 [candidate division GAL15 bacterium]